MTDETLRDVAEQKMKNPWLAVLLSKIFPGAGQIYGGAKARGIFFIAFTIALFLLIVLSFVGFLIAEDAATARTFIAVAIASSFVMLVLSFYALVDAYKIAKRYNIEHVQSTIESAVLKPWFAAFLSSLFPGIGQFYNRQVLKGIAFIVAIIIVFILEGIFTPVFIIGLVVYLFGMKDAFDSRQAANGSAEQFFHQKRAILLFMVVMFSLQSIPFAKIIKVHIIEAFKIPAGSMYPTLQIGDHFLINKTKSLQSSLKRGDIIVFPYPENPDKNFVKRVIGLGGDKVQIVNGDIYINDQPIQSTMVGIQEDGEQVYPKTSGHPTVYEERINDASYRVWYFRDKSTSNGGPWLVPQDAVFVMGDSRDNSMDSRIWGSVPRNSIKGKAMKIYWSWDHINAKVRWERIGATIH